MVKRSSGPISRGPEGDRVPVKVGVVQNNQMGEALRVGVFEAGAGVVGDVVGEREMRIKSNTKIADRGIRGESSGRHGRPEGGARGSICSPLDFAHILPSMAWHG